MKLTKPGVFPFYCTNFCSALHQEMQGYLVVKNEGATEPGAEEVNPAKLEAPPKTDAVDGERAVPANSLPEVPGVKPPVLPKEAPTAHALGPHRWARLAAPTTKLRKVKNGEKVPNVGNSGSCTSRSTSGRGCSCWRPRSS